MNSNTHSICQSPLGLRGSAGCRHDVPFVQFCGAILPRALSVPRSATGIGKAVLAVLVVLALGAGFTLAADSNAPVTVKRSSPVIATNMVAAVENMEALDNTHKLMAGDRVSFRIVEDEDESKQLPVLDSGEIEVPYLGHCRAAGQSCRELARQLKAQLEKKYYYQATVIIAVDAKAQTRGRVYLVGALRTPGAQDIPNDEVFTLSKAVIRAGGFTDFANQRKVKVTRRAQAPGGKPQTITVDVAAVLDGGKAQSDLQLEPDDLIYVEERLIRL